MTLGRTLSRRATDLIEGVKLHVGVVGPYHMYQFTIKWVTSSGPKLALLGGVGFSDALRYFAHHWG